MRDLWNELVNSVGFVISAIVVIILFPMLFFAFMGIVGDSESLAGFIFSLFVVGIPLYFLMTKPTVEQKNETLWKEKKQVVNQIQKTKTGKLLETTMEFKERTHIRKREHFDNLYNRRLDLIHMYQYGRKNGHHYYDNNLRFTKILSECKDMQFLSYDGKSYTNSFFPHSVADTVKKYRYTPYYTMKSVIDYYISRKYIKNRTEMEKTRQELLKNIRWAVTYAPLKDIYCEQSFFDIQVSSDAEEYRIIYPFGLEPLVYNFNCTAEEEEEFFANALKMVEECKKMYHKALNQCKTYKEREKFDNKYCRDRGAFSWSLQTYHGTKDSCKNTYNDRKGCSPIYERKT